MRWQTRENFGGSVCGARNLLRSLSVQNERAMSCSLTEEELESAAFDLALNAREVLGLPTDTHKDQPHQAATPFRPEVLEAPPTALQFSQRLAGGSPPLIILGCIDDRSAISRWRDPDHLSRLMGNRLVKIAATPDGRADDLKMTSHGDLVFGLPAEVEMIFKDFVDQLNGKEDGPVYYLQSQDSNLTDPTSAAGDLTPLLPDLKDSKGSLELEWATQAMGAPPEAMNLWVGEHRSRSSMHQYVPRVFDEGAALCSDLHVSTLPFEQRPL